MTTIALDILQNAPLDYYQYTPGKVTIFPQYALADSTYFALYPTFYGQDIGILASPTNTSINQFATIQECWDYYYSNAIPVILASANVTDTLNTYVAGNSVKVTQPAASQINAKANSSGLGAAAFSNNYADLTGKPTIPATQIQCDWNQAGTSALDFLKNKPTIPAAQVQSDWNATTGLGVIANKPTIPSITRTTSSITPTLVGTGATGTQVSSTKDASVKTCVSTSATASIAGAATSTVTLKICSTNNATEANWTTVGVSETSQSYALAVAISGVTGGKAQLETDLPAGWYYKLVNTGSGTHAEAIVSGQQTIYG